MGVYLGENKCLCTKFFSLQSAWKQGGHQDSRKGSLLDIGPDLLSLTTLNSTGSQMAMVPSLASVSLLVK